MAKFVVFEKVNEAIYGVVDKNSTSSGMQTVYNLGSGLIAGFAAALVSQPADTMLSKINKTKGLPGEGTTSRLIKIAKELGFRGSYAGIGARLFMVGTLTAGQFAIYGKYFEEQTTTRSNNCHRRYQEGSRCDWRRRDRKDQINDGGVAGDTRTATIVVMKKSVSCIWLGLDRIFSYASCVCVCAAAIELDFPGSSLVRQAIYICNSTIRVGNCAAQ